MSDRDIQREAPNVLICSGLDPSGGAGLLADVRVVSALGGRPIGVVTALTVQNTVAVRQVNPVDAEIVGSQLGAILSDIEVRAVKLGLLGSVELARQISYALDMTAAPVVWDPVGAPSRGRVDFDGPAFDEMLGLLARHVRVLTPNAGELAQLAHREIASHEDAIEAARHLATSIGGASVLVKGGHFEGAEVVDLLVEDDRVERIAGERIGSEDVHGTGCALASAIATHLALGADMVEACRKARELVAAQLRAPVRPGRGAPAVV